MKRGLFWGTDYDCPHSPLRCLFAEQRYRVKGAIIFERKGCVLNNGWNDSPHWFEVGHASLDEIHTALKHGVSFYPCPSPGMRRDVQPVPHEALRAMLVTLDAWLGAGGVPRKRSPRWWSQDRDEAMKEARR